MRRDRVHDIIVITGAAPNVMDDIGEFLHMAADWKLDWMAVGLDAVNKYEWPITFVVTYHPNEAVDIRDRRREYGGNDDFTLISHVDHDDKGTYDGIDVIEPHVRPSGSSALLGVRYALKKGYRRIVLCGCPLDIYPYNTFQKGWEDGLGQEQKVHIRSMSGWTRRFLGAPTEEWLRELK